MSVSDSVRLILATMGFAQLALAFAAVTSYVLTLNPSLTARLRTIAGLSALLAVAAFSLVVPSWMGGIAVMAMAVAGISAFAGSAWLCARLLGLGGERRPTVAGLPTEPTGTRSTSSSHGANIVTAPGSL